MSVKSQGSLGSTARVMMRANGIVLVGFMPARVAPAVLAQPAQPPTTAEYSIMPTTDGWK